jgi:hypothetical protein
VIGIGGGWLFGAWVCWLGISSGLEGESVSDRVEIDQRCLPTRPAIAPWRCRCSSLASAVAVGEQSEQPFDPWSAAPEMLCCGCSARARRPPRDLPQRPRRDRRDRDLPRRSQRQPQTVQVDCQHRQDPRKGPSWPSHARRDHQLKLGRATRSSRAALGPRLLRTRPARPLMAVDTALGIGTAGSRPRGGGLSRVDRGPGAQRRARARSLARIPVALGPTQAVVLTRPHPQRHGHSSVVRGVPGRTT